MRAVRFAAVLECSIAAETLQAISGALDVFSKVARERVRVEAVKLLESRRPSLGLLPMVATGLWSLVFGDHLSERRPSLAAEVDALPANARLRLAAIVRALREPLQFESVLMGLKPSRQERDYVLGLARADLDALVAAERPATVRRWVAALGQDRLADALDLAGASADVRAFVGAACEGAPLTIGELSVGAKTLIEAGLAVPGPALGALLQRLLDNVLEDPANNEFDRLLEFARQNR